MDNTVALINSTITQAELWGIVGKIVPIALTTTLFALGYYLVRKQLKKISHAKGGM